MPQLDLAAISAVTGATRRAEPQDPASLRRVLKVFETADPRISFIIRGNVMPDDIGGNGLGEPDFVRMHCVSGGFVDADQMRMLLRQEPHPQQHRIAPLPLQRDLAILLPAEFDFVRDRCPGLTYQDDGPRPGL